MDMKRSSMACAAALVLAALAIAAYSQPSNGVSPATMARIGTVDERYQSFNIEMVEVTGGRFWKPYGAEVAAALQARTQAGPVGMDPALYRQRAPIDLANPRLRKLAAALGPAYVRVSGTWANSTYFQNSEEAAPVNPPAGFNGALTRRQWKGVVDFARAVDARIVTSFASSAGTRDAAGVWTPAVARQFLAYTRSIADSIAAAEFMNEPTFAAMGGAPPGYDAAAYARDIAVFRAFVKEAAPGMTILGPGSVGEGTSLVPAGMVKNQLKSEDLLSAAGPAFDAFSYHFYGAVSKRCAGAAPASGTTPEDALSEEWLARTGRAEAFYAGLRDRFAPGKPLWVTETADAACGGNPWGSTFLDSFRYLDQLGRLARSGVQVVAHNTLAASDYGLLDENALTPRPNYWAALVWHRLMGRTVLDPGRSPAPALHLYAHCLRGQPGGVALLAINTSRGAPQWLELPAESRRYTLTARNLEDTRVSLNGNELTLGAGDELPQLTGVPTQSGRVTFAPASITFLAIPDANNGSCR